MELNNLEDRGITEHNAKLQIYRGMIQYILLSTNYCLNNVADLTSSSIQNIRSIYCENLLPVSFSSEIHLVKLYQFVLEINLNNKTFYNYLPIPKSYRQLIAS